MRKFVEVRDPLHGSIGVAPDELAVIDHPFFQRLRSIRQLGFSDLSFPGATHTRYLHSIGAMYLAGEIFDNVFGRSNEDPFSGAPEVRARLRQTLRLAALLHDSGHAPLSHATEFAMGLVRELGRPLKPETDPERRASHEDYTLRIIVDSSLTPLLERHSSVPASAVAGLIDDGFPVPDGYFEHAGIDWRPMLSQVISSELDCDRMDYLRRDSYFTGANYGRFDLRWVLSNLAWHPVDDRAHLAVRERALYAVEDFLLSRHHMFLMVYFHQRSVVYEEMLRRYFGEGGDGYILPSNVEDYHAYDDPHLLGHLRKSRNPWAVRIVEARPFKLLIERSGAGPFPAVESMAERMKERGLPFIPWSTSRGISKYVGTDPGSTIFVIGKGRRGRPGPALPLHEVAELFDRYRTQRRIERIYVPEGSMEQAGDLIDDLLI
jgi:HD superfamily phosphohydrolase